MMQLNMLQVMSPIIKAELCDATKIQTWTLDNFTTVKKCLW